MIVRAVWEFDVDTDGLDPEFVDIPGLAKELTKAELSCLLSRGELTIYDFEYEIVEEEE